MLSRRIFLTTVAAFAVAAPTVALAWSAPPFSFDPVLQPRNSEIPALDADVRASRIAWLETNATKLSSVDFDDDEFKDLESFRKAVGDARIVMLGEMSYGDGTTFRAKARMVRFLHEEMGFDVLAFESGLYDMHKVWERVREGDSVRKTVRRGMHGAWSRSRQMQPLIDYVGKRSDSRRPLALAGFDCQFVGSATHDDMLDDLVSFLDDNNVEAKEIANWRTFRRVMEKITEPSYDGKWKPSAEDQQLVYATFDALIEQFATMEDEDADFWRQSMKSSKAMVGLLFRANVEKPSPAHLNERDAMMADNLLWLAKTAHPTAKIIVWSTSYHNARNYQAVDAESALMPMGHRAWQELGPEMYSLAFTAFEGQTGMVHEDAKELAEPARDSLEGLWGASTQRRAFLDLRHVADGGDWLKAPFAARVLSEQTMMADWTKVVDGVVFLRAMQPSRSID